VKGQQWVRLLPLALLIILGLAGLRGAVGTPRWDGPLHRDGLAVGLALEAVFAVLALLTVRRHRSAHQELVAQKLRITLFAALGVGAVAVAVVTLLGLNLHLFVLRPGRASSRHPLPVPTPIRAPHAHQAAASNFHFPLAAVLYTLLVLLILAGIAVSIWWARRLRPALGARDDALIVEDSEDLREAVESGRSALRTVDDARAAIIACYLAMEQSLAERGTARAVADTPDELLARARTSGVVRGTAASRLTALFYEARFSSHPLGTDQRDAAERALDELAAALAQSAAESATEPEAAGAGT
jgi:Domain of unknown function (DUF4129)